MWLSKLCSREYDQQRAAFGESVISGSNSSGRVYSSDDVETA